MRLGSRGLFALVLLFGVAGTGLLVRLFNVAGYGTLGSVAWGLGYGTTIAVLWWGWVRPLDLTGGTSREEPPEGDEHDTDDGVESGTATGE